jgi:hypothetical protein
MSQLEPRLRQRELARRPLVLLPAAILLAACGTAGPNGNGGPSPSSSPSPALSSPVAIEPCTLPVVHDTYDGFHIGVPDGWNLFTLGGTVVVSHDLAGTEETVVHPALMTPGESRSGLFSTLLALLQSQLKGAGATLTFTASQGEQPSASVNVSSSAGAVSGHAHLEVLSDATAHGSAEGVLIASWAPAAQLSADGRTLDQIGACYGVEPATLFHVISDQVFTYEIPPNWSVGVENQDTLELTMGRQASATYIYFQFLQPSTGVTSGQKLIAYELNHLAIQVRQVLSSSSGPSTPCTAGTCTQSLEEFTASLNGATVHGLAYASVSGGPAGVSGYMRLGLADANLWNSVNGGLLHMLGSIQHDFNQDIQEWANLQRQWLRFDQQVQGFDYALNNMDLTHDPITGQNFDTPYQNWDQNGVAGPGYYDRAGNKLQVITPGQ